MAIPGALYVFRRVGGHQPDPTGEVLKTGDGSQAHNDGRGGSLFPGRPLAICKGVDVGGRGPGDVVYQLQEAAQVASVKGGGMVYQRGRLELSDQASPIFKH